MFTSELYCVTPNTFNKLLSYRQEMLYCETQVSNAAIEYLVIHNARNHYLSHTLSQLDIPTGSP